MSNGEIRNGDITTVDSLPNAAPSPEVQQTQLTVEEMMTENRERVRRGIIEQERKKAAYQKREPIIDEAAIQAKVELLINESLTELNEWVELRLEGAAFELLGISSRVHVGTPHKLARHLPGTAITFTREKGIEADDPLIAALINRPLSVEELQAYEKKGEQRPRHPTSSRFKWQQVPDRTSAQPEGRFR